MGSRFRDPLGWVCFAIGAVIGFVGARMLILALGIDCP